MKEIRHKVWAVVVLAVIAIMGICYLVTELRTKRIVLQTAIVTEEFCCDVIAMPKCTEVITLKVVKGEKKRGILLLTWDCDLIRLNPARIVRISSYCDDGITGSKVKTTDGTRYILRESTEKIKASIRAWGIHGSKE